MTTIKEIVEKPSGPLLNIYVTAGFPELGSLPTILSELEKSGADMVEIGIPYSDPLSDGPIIQNSSTIALKNGISLDRIFDQLRENPSGIPKILMGYYNSVLQFGLEKFCEQCAETGVSGIILPDLPIEFYLQHYQVLFERHGLSNIFLVTPETSEQRIRYIDENSTSFIYAVSSSSTTGSGGGIGAAESYLSRLDAMSLKHPVMVGFNIKTPEDFDMAARHTRGSIVGSAFINHIAKRTDLADATSEFVNYITKNRKS